jgi:hypothetical protein
MRAYIYLAKTEKNIAGELKNEIINILEEDDTFDNEITKSYQHGW